MSSHPAPRSPASAADNTAASVHSGTPKPEPVVVTGGSGTEPEPGAACRALVDRFRRQGRGCWLCEQVARRVEAGQTVGDDDNWHLEVCVDSWDAVHAAPRSCPAAGVDPVEVVPATVAAASEVCGSTMVPTVASIAAPVEMPVEVSVPPIVAGGVDAEHSVPQSMPMTATLRPELTGADPTGASVVGGGLSLAEPALNPG